MSQLLENHPLIERSGLCSITNLADWLREWEQATRFTHLDALLSQGFSPKVWMNNEANKRERLRFYLAIADGFALDAEAFESSETDPRVRKETSWRRKRLAERAFAVLTRKVFKNREDTRRPPSWLPLLKDNTTLQAVLTFLRIDPETKHIVNLPPIPDRPQDEREHVVKSQLEILRNFTLDLIRIGFRDGSMASFQQTAIQAAYPQFVELLVRLGEAQRLQKRNAYPFDDACWATLERLALEPITVERVRYKPEEVTPASVEEAAALGSEAARTLILRRQFKEYDERQEEIEAARLQREEADARLERLNA